MPPPVDALGTATTLVGQGGGPPPISGAQAQPGQMFMVNPAVSVPYSSNYSSGQASGPVLSTSYLPAQGRAASYTSGGPSVPQAAPWKTQVSGGDVQAKMAQAGSNILKIEPYTAKTFIVRGGASDPTNGTKPFKEALKNLGENTWTLFISRPKHGQGAGWCYRYTDLDKVVEYVSKVNTGQIAKPAPTIETQRVSWEVAKPQKEQVVLMKYGDNFSQVAKYRVSDLIRNGWMVIGATLYNAADPNDVKTIVIINGHWQVFGLMVPHQMEFQLLTGPGL